MSFINTLIILAKEHGISQTIYQTNMLFSCVCVFAFMYFYKKNYNISTRIFLLSMIVLYPVGYITMSTYAWVANGFDFFGVGNIVRIFVFYPIFLYPVAKFTGTKLRLLLDYIAPGLALLQGMDHISCVFPGCCHGYPASWGIWNISVEKYLFPNQWLESAASLLIFIFLLRLGEKRNHCGDGKQYAYFLILFGVSRFFLEFLRDNEKLIIGISNLAFHAAFMVVIGIGFLIYAKCKNESNHP